MFQPKMKQMEIQSQEQWVLFRLEKFYGNAANVQKVKDILEGKSILSLRLVDWFVTNYAKKFNTSFVTKSGKHVIVYLSYKSHLKAYSKKMFDPFCRSKRIKFMDFDTTVGQLNFFEWAITDDILDYLETNHDQVHQDMETRLKEVDTEPHRKRHELSKSATNSMKYHDVKVTVKFD
jgi:hypothetical protein